MAQSFILPERKNEKEHGRYSLGDKITVVIALLCVLLSACSADKTGSPNDVSRHVEILGNPAQDKYPAEEKIYPRNVWDMQVFNGRVYFGIGNSSSTGPAQNAGGGEVRYYDPELKKFEIEFRTDEEQIDRFRVLAGTLYVPGHDPTDNWDLGNFYRLEKGGWKKHRNLPGGIHCYDIFSFKGKLFAALGTKPRSEFVVVSEDEGKTWRSCGLYGQRAYSFFTVGDKLYVSLYRGVAEFDGKAFRERRTGRWFAGWYDRNKFRLVVRPVNFGGHAVYIGAGSVNDHQWAPFGLYVARSARDIRAIDLPGKHWDLVTRDKRLYVLSAIEPVVGHSPVTITVSQTNDLKRWTNVLSFSAPTFARSFEILDGDFYFGLGCEVRHQAPETGTLLRVKGEHLRVPGVGATHASPSWMLAQ